MSCQVGTEFFSLGCHPTRGCLHQEWKGRVFHQESRAKTSQKDNWLFVLLLPGDGRVPEAELALTESSVTMSGTSKPQDLGKRALDSSLDSAGLGMPARKNF